MRRISIQLRQTIISTGVVGACFGAVAVAGLLLVAPGSDARLSAQGIAPPPLIESTLKLGLVFAGITAATIIIFGLLPAMLGKLFGYIAKRTG